MKIARLDTEAKLVEINGKTDQRLKQMSQRLAELQFAHRQREEYTREIENKHKESLQEIQQAEERQKEQAVR